MNGISGSALQAYSAGQQVTVNNVANILDVNFKASRTSYQENRNGGVTAAFSRTSDTVDISREATDLLANTLGFKGNISVVKAADDMTRSLLNIMG